MSQTSPRSNRSRLATNVTPFLPDVLLPVQLESRPAVAAERHLALAVLEDALRSFCKYAVGQSRRDKRLFEEDYDWIYGKNQADPFSFDNLCNALGVDPGYIRGQLRRYYPASPQASRAAP